MADFLIRRASLAGVSKDEEILIEPNAIPLASMEGEPGVPGSLATDEAGQEDGSGVEGQLDRDRLTIDPDQAAGFVMAIAVDAPAMAHDNAHGTGKSTREPDAEILAMNQTGTIHRDLADTPPVMHGSRPVPRHSPDPINENGDAMPHTWSIPVEEIERGIRHGVRKLDIDIDCRMATSDAMRRFVRRNLEVFDPHTSIHAAMNELQRPMHARLERSRTAGHAHVIKPAPLSDRARRHVEGAAGRRVAAA